jgi:hypothetical protein
MVNPVRFLALFPHHNFSSPLKIQIAPSSRPDPGACWPDLWHPWLDLVLLRRLKACSMLVAPTTIGRPRPQGSASAMLATGV